MSVPSWVQDAIFYQIFPDRFNNGDPSNDPANVQPWGAEPTEKGFQGGDLKGITNKLDYLQELGISAEHVVAVHAPGLGLEDDAQVVGLLIVFHNEIDVGLLLKRHLSALVKGAFQLFDQGAIIGRQFQLVTSHVRSAS